MSCLSKVTARSRLEDGAAWRPPWPTVHDHSSSGVVVVGLGAASAVGEHAATMAAESITNGYGRPTTAVFEDSRLPAPISFAVSPDVLIYDGPSADDAYFVQTAFRLWPLSLTLCRWLCAHPEIVRGKRVVELGAGFGALGLVCAALGAAHVGVDAPRARRDGHRELRVRRRHRLEQRQRVGHVGEHDVQRAERSADEAGAAWPGAELDNALSRD